MYEEETDLIQNDEPELDYEDDAVEAIEPTEEIPQEEVDFPEELEDYSAPQTSEAPKESFAEKSAERAGEAVENAGEAIEHTGQAVETTGKAVETTGKSVEKAGEVAEVSGRAMQTAGKALDSAGQAIAEAGAGLDSTGVGAVAGVGLNVIGAGMSGVGKGADVAGQATEKAGTATKKAGEGISQAGKNIKKQGNDIKNKGRELKQKGADIKNKGFNKKQQYHHKKTGQKLSDTLKGKTNISLKDAKGKGTLKLPLKLKIILIVLLVSIPIILLLFLVVLLGGNDHGNSGSGTGSAGNYKYGATCTTVTVTNSGCDANATNCTNKYDGEVSFEDYVAGVVAAEVGGANNLELYKALAVAARTYYLSHTSNDNCKIEGNASSQAYINVDSSSNASMIRQAVEETKGLVLIKNDKLMSANYSAACVVKDDTEKYYIRYGTSSLGKVNFQGVPKSWDSDKSHAYSGNLASWYSKVDKTSTDYDKKSCPGNHDYGMSQLGALYLATSGNYTYDNILKYYYGSDAEIVENNMILSGAEGFLNPTRTINCTSPYGNRTHPVENTPDFHSGLDIAIPAGEPIYAAKDGTVTAVEKNVTAINNCNYGYGNYIIIDHGDGSSTLYAHIKYDTIEDTIEVGTTVKQGMQIGQVGSTGCSTGNHLHYEIKMNGSTVDPTDYLNLTGATGECKR